MASGESSFRLFTIHGHIRMCREWHFEGTVPQNHLGKNKMLKLKVPIFNLTVKFYVLIDWVRSGRTGKYLARGHGVRTESSKYTCFNSYLARAIDKIPVWGQYAILEGPDGFFCARHHGDFLNTFAMKARAGPNGSYDKRKLLLSFKTFAEIEEKFKYYLLIYPTSFPLIIKVLGQFLPTNLGNL